MSSLADCIKKHVPKDQQPYVTASLKEKQKGHLDDNVDPIQARRQSVLDALDELNEERADIVRQIEKKLAAAKPMTLNDMMELREKLESELSKQGRITDARLEERLSKLKREIARGMMAEQQAKPKSIKDQLKDEWNKQATAQRLEEEKAAAVEKIKDSTSKMMEALKRVNKIVGDRGSFSTKETDIDESTYSLVKAELNTAWKHAQEAGQAIAEFVKIAVEALSHKASPYFMKWVDEEVQEVQDKDKDGGVYDTINDGLAEAKETQGKDDNRGDGRESAGNVRKDDGGRDPGEVRGSTRTGNDGNVGRGEGTDNNEVGPDRGAPGRGKANGGRNAPGVGGIVSELLGVQRRDHRITPGSIDRVGGWKTTAKSNLDAIELYKKIMAENRPATPEEQVILAKYVGWGASELANNMFPGVKQYGGINDYAIKPEWKDLVLRLKAMMTPEELKTAAKSTQYAHYTSEKVIRSIYKALERLGFDGGKILEPGMGVGNFVGLIPESMRSRTTYTGVEMDNVSAGIAKLLYPEQNMLHDDFIKRKFPKNFFDASIGNPPFGDIPILSDPDYRKYNFSIHNYFFAKSIDRVKPGGLLVFVTSRYTMDAIGDKARKYIADRADLLGAIRLPQTAFKDNAGTEVVTDVLFLRKREEGAESGGQSWLGTSKIGLKEEVRKKDPWGRLYEPGKAPEPATIDTDINEYFAAHPEMVLGEHSLVGSMYSNNEYSVVPKTEDLDAEFATAVENLPEGVYSSSENTTKTKKAKAQVQASVERDFNPKNKKEGGIYLHNDGKTIMITDFGSGVDVSTIKKIPKKEYEMLKDYMPLRDKVKLSLQAQLQGGDWAKALKDLQKEYKKFVAKYGNLKSYTLRKKTIVDENDVTQIIETPVYTKEKWLKSDTEYSLVMALETYNEDDGSISESKFLTERTVLAPVTPDIKTIPDALAVSLDQLGKLDIDHVSTLINRPVEEVVVALGDLLYEDHNGGGLVLADDYLSGEVVTKLEEATEAAKVDPKFKRNVAALEAVQPEPLTAQNVKAKLGGHWIPMKHYKDFCKEVLEMPNAIVFYDPQLGSWEVKGYKPQSLRTANSEWGTPERGRNEILSSVLNNGTIKITVQVKNPDGGKTTVLLKEETVAANEIAKKMKAKFSSWVWEDSERGNELLEIYNRAFNNLAPRKLSGKHLTLPGMSNIVEAYEHQKDAIWRIIQTGSTYLNHSVGAGKTLVMIAAGMEMKRLGLIKKPIYVVPGHMLGQFSQEFQELYPAANIMVADETGFHKNNRKRFVSQAALNNPDAIVMTHSSFQLVKSNQESIAPVKADFIDQMLYALEAMRENGEDQRKIKRMQNMIEKAEQRFDSLVGEGDNVVTFEEMGVDFMFVDEAHVFRKLDFSSSRQIKGIDPNGSKAALDMFIKTAFLSTRNKGRSHVFASGTPIVNTIGEMFTVLKFFDRDGLYKDNLQHFDTWANMFGDVESDYEQNAAGRYEIVERFARFVNVPEMMSRVRQFTDVLTSKQLGERVERPDIEGGKANVVLAPRSQELKDYQDDVLQTRMEESKKWKPSPNEKGNPDPVVNIITDGRLASIDTRLVVPGQKENPKSKLNIYTDYIIEEYNNTKDNEYFYPKTTNISPVKGGCQVCFYNVGFGKGVETTRGFSPRKHVMDRLVKAGIPLDHVAWIDDYDSMAKKQALFKLVRDGHKRILFGSAKKMGTGMNVQTRLTALQYLDAPWFPADVEQPDGRIIRQGNQNKVVRINRFATDASYDSTMWGMVARKARSIEQAWLGDKDVRTIEDVSEVSQYAMASAMSSGDQRMIQLVGLEADIERLRLLRSNHTETQFKLDRNLRQNLEEIDRRKGDIKILEEIKARHPQYVFADKADVMIGKTKYTKKAEFNEAVKEQIFKRILTVGDKSEFTGEARFTVGTIDGENVVAKIYNYYDSLRFDLVLDLHPKEQTSLLNTALGAKASEVEDLLGDIQTKAINALNRVDDAINKKEYRIKELESENTGIRKRIGAPFGDDQILTEKVNERTRIQRELEDEGEAYERSRAEKKAAEEAAAKGDGESGSMLGEDAKLSRAGNVARPSSLEELNPKQKRIVKQLEKNGKVEVVTDAQAQAILSGNDETSKLSKNGKVQGFVLNGKAYIIPENIEAGNLWGVLRHEIGVHLGQLMQNDSEFKGILATLERLRKSSTAQGDLVRKAYARVPKDTKPEHVAEEVLAYLVETAPELGIVQKIVTMIKRLLVKFGVSPDIFGVDDYVSLAESALKREAGPMTGAGGNQDAQDVMMSKRTKPVQQGDIKYSFSSAMDDAMDYTKDLYDKKGDILTAAKGAWKNKNTYDPGYKKDTSWLQKSFGLVSHYSKQIPAFKRAFDHALKNQDLKNMFEQELTHGVDENGNAEKFIETVDKLRKTDRAAYDSMSRYLNNRDVNQIGYSVKDMGEAAGDKRYVVRNINKTNTVHTFSDEDAAWEKVIQLEADDYLFAGNSKAAVNALVRIRIMNDRMYRMRMKRLNEMIEFCRLNGLELPKIVEVVDGKNVQVNLRQALLNMGQHRGYYMPRNRDSGAWTLYATKNGAPPFLKNYDIKAVADGKKALLERDGYRVTVRQANTLSEDVFAELGSVLSQQAVLNKSMGGVDDTDAPKTLEDIGLAGKWVYDEFRGEMFVVSGDSVKNFTQILEDMGGKKQYSKKKIKDTTDVERFTEYRFKDVNEKEITEMLINASPSANMFQDVALKFAKAFVSQYADVLRSRGSRSAMIARKDAKGDEVARGYEEDALTRVTKAAYSLAGGEAKSRTALNMIKAISGQDVSWADFVGVKEFAGDFAEYEQSRLDAGLDYIDRASFDEIKNNYDESPEYDDYLEFVKGRGIDPAKQKTGHSEAIALFKDMMRNDERTDRIIGTLKGLAVLKYLGFRVAAPFVNITNMVVGVPAAMMGYGKIPIKDVFKHIGSAYNDYYRFVRKKGVLSPEMKRVFELIEKRGWDKATFNQEGLAVMKGQLSYGYSKMIETSMYMFTLSEQWNRVASITAAYKGLLETNPEMTFEEKMTLAKEISDKAHGIYGKANRPSAMRGGSIGANVLQMAYVFKTFAHNFLATMADLAINEKDRKAALWMAFSPVIFGATSSMGMAIIIKAIGKLMGSDDPEEDFFKAVESVFGSYAGNFSRFGIFGSLDHGISLKGSLAIGVLDLPTSFKDLIGAPGSVATDLYEGSGDVFAGNVSKGVEKMLPLAFGNPLKAYREATEGVTTKSNAPVFFEGQPLRADVIDAFLRALSFNPSRIAGAREKIYGETVQKTAMAERRAGIYAKVKKARLNGDDMEDITIEIAAYNQRAKREGATLITSKSLRTVLKRSKISEE